MMETAREEVVRREQVKDVFRPSFQLQHADPARLHERIVRPYQVMHEAFFEERGLIPEDHFCKMAYEDLEADPLGQIRRVYRELSLPDFEAARPSMEDHVRSLAGYKKNRHPDLPADLRADVARAWRRCFEEWNYPL